MNFYKPILLPSNNVVYNSIIEVKELDVSFLVELKTNFLDLSENDLIYSIIKRYTNIKDPAKIYYKDVQYIYFFFLSLLNNNDELKIPNICPNCNDKINIKISLSKFKTKYATKEDFTEKKFIINDFTFYFRNRLFEDNIISGLINFENQEKDINGIINFLKPQCTKIVIQNTEYDNSFLKDAFLEIRIENILNIFDELRSESWGINSFFTYQCKKCNYDNKVFISDPYRSSHYFTSNDSFNNLELLELLVQLSSFKTLSYSELINLPLSIWEPTVKIINDTIKKKYGGKNSVGYLESFHEELQ
jgi:hypothetical protein